MSACIAAFLLSYWISHLILKHGLQILLNHGYSLRQNIREVCHFCKRRKKEDTTLLRLSALDALAYMLPGFSLKCIDKCCHSKEMDLNECSCNYLPKTKCNSSFSPQNSKETPLENNNGSFTAHSVNKANNNTKEVHSIMRMIDNEAQTHSSTGAHHLKHDEILLTPQGSPDSPKISALNNNYMSVDEGNTSEVAEVTTSLSISIASSQLSEDDLQAMGDLELESDAAMSDAFDKNSHESNTSSSGNNCKDYLKFSQLNNQRFSFLKDSQTDSSTYLDDYLKLLTSRSPSSQIPPSIKSKNDHRRCSVPTFRPKSESSKYDRHRNLSGSSDRSNRSLGSTYLDSYLGNLTEHAWIIYPTEDKSSDSSKIKEKSLKIREPLRSSHAPSNQRRLHFINPEKFFNQNSSKTLPQKSSLSSSTSLVSNCSDKDPDSLRSRSNTMDSATSPDISSSIFDKDLDEGSPVKPCALDSGINIPEQSGNGYMIDDEDTIKESRSFSEHSETCMSSLNSCSSELSHSTSGVVSMSCDASSISNDLKPFLNQVQSDETLTPNFLPSRHDGYQNQPFENGKPCQEKSSIYPLDESVSPYPNEAIRLKPSINFKIGGNVRIDSQIDEEHSSSSDLSSATEPSTIVLAGEQLQQISDIEQSSLSSDVDKVGVHSYEEKRVNFSQSTESLKSIKKKNVIHFAKSDSSENTVNDLQMKEASLDAEVVPYADPAATLVYMLKSKHQKEIDELKCKQAEEMQEFLRRLREFSNGELACLVQSYQLEGRDISSGFDPLEHSSNSQGSIIHEQSFETNNSNTNIGNTTSHYSCPSPHQSPVTPSFYLHEKENMPCHTSAESPALKEQITISRLFGAARRGEVSSARSIAKNVKSAAMIQDNFGSSSYFSEHLFLPKHLTETHIPTYSNAQPTINSTIMSKVNNFKSDGIEEEEDNCSSLDLIPSKESDLKKQKLSNQVVKGISKFQALVRGRRIRLLMKTNKVQQLLRTLSEVSKFSQEFHKDILSTNIRKGDIDFHKALFQEEEQSRRKLWEIAIQAKPSEQIKVIQEDRATRAQEHKKRSSLPVRHSLHPSPKAQTNLKSALPTSIKNNKGISPNRIGLKRGRLAVPNSTLTREIHAPMVRLCNESPRLCRSTSTTSDSDRTKHSNLSLQTNIRPSKSFNRSPVKNKASFSSKLDTEVIAIHKSRAGNNVPRTQHPPVSLTKKNSGLLPQWKNPPRSSSIPRKPWR